MITAEDYYRAKENGINRKALEARVRSGMPVSYATVAPINKNRSKWLPVAIENGIKVSTFNTRVYGLGWDWEVAATRPTGNEGRRYIK